MKNPDASADQEDRAVSPEKAIFLVSATLIKLRTFLMKDPHCVTQPIMREIDQIYELKSSIVCENKFEKSFYEVVSNMERKLVLSLLEKNACPEYEVKLMDIGKYVESISELDNGIVSQNDWIVEIVSLIVYLNCLNHHYPDSEERAC